MPGPLHDSCTACIVGVARECKLRLRRSDSTVTHLTDSFLGLPDAHAIGKTLTVKRRRRRRRRIFVFNDTIEGPRAPAFKPGRVTSDTGEHEEEDLSCGSVLIPLPTRGAMHYVHPAPGESCTTESEAEGSVLVPEWPEDPSLSAVLMFAPSGSHCESVGSSTRGVGVHDQVPHFCFFEAGQQNEGGQALPVLCITSYASSSPGQSTLRPPSMCTPIPPCVSP